jgi:uncharacterized small protein (DUF1192 family)
MVRTHMVRMTTDIVERLRGVVSPVAGSLCREAADEIERLKTELTDRSEYWLWKEHGEMNVELIACQAEIERLRAALERYASESFWRNDYADAGGFEVPVPYSAEAFHDCGGIAREALGNDDD